MAKSNLMETEIKRAEARGDVNADEWTGAVRSLENPAFELNDEFTFPKEYKIFEGNMGQYILVQTKSGSVKQFFPSTFTKVRWECQKDKDGMIERIGENPKMTKGSAAEKFREFGGIAEAMDFFKEKTVKFSGVERIQTTSFNRPGELQGTLIYTIDLV